MSYFLTRFITMFTVLTVGLTVLVGIPYVGFLVFSITGLVLGLVLDVLVALSLAFAIEKDS